ncbi:hypothetical protein POVCU1_020730, partial [Plasmodium ovale curtisi]
MVRFPLSKGSIVPIIVKVEHGRSFFAFLSHSLCSSGGRSVRCCSSIFDMIARKKAELEQRRRNKGGILEEKKAPQRGSYSEAHDGTQTRITKGKKQENSETCDEAFAYTCDEKGDKDAVRKIEEGNKLKKGKIYCGRSVDSKDNVEKCVKTYLEIPEEDIYKNKMYLLKYAKNLQPNDELYKYRLVTKYYVQAGDNTFVVPLKGGGLLNGGILLNRGDLNRGDLSRGDLNRGDLNRGDLNRGDLNRGDINRGDPNQMETLIENNLEMEQPGGNFHLSGRTETNEKSIYSNPQYYVERETHLNDNIHNFRIYQRRTLQERRNNERSIYEEEYERENGEVQLWGKLPYGNKKINELSHLPLHLFVEKTKLKIDSTNVVRKEIKAEEIKAEEKKAEEKKAEEISYGGEYMHMFINLFIYIGICGFRNINLLNILSIKMQMCMVMNGKRYTPEQRTRENISKMKTHFVGLHQAVMNIRKNANPQLEEKEGSYFLSQTRNGGEGADHATLDTGKKVENRKDYIENVYRKGKDDKQKDDPIATPLSASNPATSSSSAATSSSSAATSSSSATTSSFSDAISYSSGMVKSCVRFSYSASDKINFNRLKKKKELALYREKSREDVTRLKYANVENFRKSKMEVSREAAPELPTKRGKKEGIVKKFFFGFHPALIRLHNRRLFQRKLNGKRVTNSREHLHKSETYTEKTRRKRNTNIKQLYMPSYQKDIRLRRYRKVKSLRNTCMSRYKHIWGNTSDAVLKYVNEEYEGTYPHDNNVGRYASKGGLLDMLARGDEVHFDDYTIVDYSICASGRAKRLRAYRNLVRRSQEITRKELLRDSNSTNMEKEYKRNEAVKWVYRFKNCSNMFNKDKGVEIPDGDVKRLDAYLLETFSGGSVGSGDSSDNGRRDVPGERNHRGGVSLRDYAQVAGSCSNLYYFDERLIFVMLERVQETLDTFYAEQKRKKVETGKKDMNIQCMEEKSHQLHLFENTWKFLIASLQTTHFAKSILEIDQRYNTVIKLINLFYSKFNVFLTSNMMVHVHLFAYNLARLYFGYLDICVVIPGNAFPFKYVESGIHRRDMDIRIHTHLKTYLSCMSFYVCFSSLCLKWGGRRRINTCEMDILRKQQTHRKVPSQRWEKYISSEEITEKSNMYCIEESVIESQNVGYIYRTLFYFFKYVKLLRDKNLVLHPKEGTQYLHNIILFYYFFKKEFRRKNINYLNEENFRDILPLFIVQILKKRKIKEIPLDTIFFRDMR